MKDDGGSFWKYLIGLGVGVGLTYAYVRFGYTMPGVVQLGGKVASEAMIATAEVDLYNHEAPPEARQRALAVIVGQKPEWFLEMDESLGRPIFEEAQRLKAVRTAKLLKHRPRAYEMALEKPALRKVYEKRFGIKDTEQLKRRMLISDIQQDEFLAAFLQQRYPQLSPNDWAEFVLDVYRHEFRPTHAAMSDGNANTGDRL